MGSRGVPGCGVPWLAIGGYLERALVDPVAGTLQEIDSGPEQSRSIPGNGMAILSIRPGGSLLCG